MNRTQGTILALALTVVCQTALAQSCQDPACCDGCDAFNIIDHGGDACDSISSCCASRSDICNDSSCGGSRGCGPLGNWKLTSFARLTFYDRDEPDDLGGNGLISVNGGDTLLDNSGLDPSEETGYLVGVRLQKDDCLHYELAYFSTEWDLTRSFAGAGNLNAILGTVNYQLADQISVLYDSEIHSVEANRWRKYNNHLSWLVGFRYFNLEDRLNMTAVDAGFTSNYLIDADNNLYGAQIGGMEEMCLGESALLSVSGKAGVYGNDAEQSVLLRDVNNTVITRNFSNSNDITSFVGEFDANLTAWLSDSLSARIGYQLIWVEGVALAPEQFQQNAVAADAAIKNEGSLFVNGAYVGFELLL